MQVSDLFPPVIINLAEDRTFLGELGVGLVIKGVNTTPDVQPGEIRRQAAKLGMDTDDEGRPPVARSDGKIPHIKAR